MKKVGSYVLLGEIASGGMASVHLGRLSGPAGFARTVAIKRLHPQFAKDPEFVSMFLDEARLAARIRHPNVVQTLDVVASEGELFLVMDYVEGESLARLLKRLSKTETRIPLPVVSSVVSGVLRGLHAAHEAKGDLGEPLEIVHRDISPQNLIIGADGVVRVLDFGIAKAVGRLQTTREGAIKGKLPYMAPEQLRGQKLSARTDVYAVGVVLWECLAGERLFGGDEGHVVERILLGTIPAPSSRAPVPDSIDAIVARATARAHDDRYPDAAAMATALEQAVRPALSSEVASWLDGVAGNSLRVRAARVTAQLQSGAVSASESLLTPLSGEMSLAEAVQKSGFGGSSGGRAAPTIPESSPTPTVLQPAADTPVERTPPGAPAPAAAPAPEPLASAPTGEHENTLNRPLERPIAQEEQSDGSSLTGMSDLRRRRWSMGAAFALASVLGFGLAAWRCGRTDLPGPATPAPTVPSASATGTPEAPTAAIGPPVTAPEDAGVTAVDPIVDAGTSADAGKPGGKRVIIKQPFPGSKPPKRVDCTIPFTVDATGKRVYRRECLK